MPFFQHFSETTSRIKLSHSETSLTKLNLHDDGSILSAYNNTINCDYISVICPMEKNVLFLLRAAGICKVIPTGRA